MAHLCRHNGTSRIFTASSTWCSHSHNHWRPIVIAEH